MKKTGRIFRRLAITLALAGGLASGLAACDTIGENVTNLVEGKIELPCPPYNIIADATRRVRFRDGPGRDLIDVDTDVQITDVSVECFSDVSRKSRAGTMSVFVALAVTAARGPANRNREARFKYFIAVADRANKILYREAFDSGTQFPGNESRRIIRTENIKLKFPILSGQTGKNFRVLTGLILSREELEYNRQEREARTSIRR